MSTGQEIFKGAFLVELFGSGVPPGDEFTATTYVADGQHHSAVNQS
jgi:hypothetical protein